MSRKVTKRHSKKQNRKVQNRKVQNRKTQKRKVMRGGDHNGIVNLPGAYFGDGTKGYYPAGSPELAGSDKQVSVSQGTMWADGKMAGPNLYPMLGGGCGCGPKRRAGGKKTKTMHKG